MKGHAEIFCFFVLLLPMLVFSEQNAFPVVMWHGMGDTCSSDAMTSFKSTIEKEIPGVYVKSLCLGSSSDQDFTSGFFLQSNKQVEEACEIIASDPMLKNGFNALGFSQGGLFLRAVAQRCPEPKMKVLITFGAPHQGVYGFPSCSSKNFACDYLRRFLSIPVYWSWMQRLLVQAQYWKDPRNVDKYVESSIFLADINNERAVKNTSYAHNLAALEKFVLVRFNNDTVMQPGASGWFEFYKSGSGDDLEPLENTPMYQEDWLGLKALDKRGALHRLALDTDHLQFSMPWFIKNILHSYLVPNTVNL